MLVVLFLTPTWNLAQESSGDFQPSLVELARQERDRRAATGSAPQVITNATIKGIRGLVSTSAAPPSVGAEEEGAGGEGTESEGSEVVERSAEEWAAMFDGARLDLQTAVNSNMVLQLKMNDLRNSYFRESDGSRKAQIQQELEQTQDAIQGSRQEVQEARSAIQALEGEAREAGVSPADIREMVGDLPEEQSITTSPES